MQAATAVFERFNAAGVAVDHPDIKRFFQLDTAFLVHFDERHFVVFARQPSGDEGADLAPSEDEYAHKSFLQSNPAVVSLRTGNHTARSLQRSTDVTTAAFHTRAVQPDRSLLILFNPIHWF
jgi:HJR/Mrr/RecB family endonuclease